MRRLLLAFALALSFLAPAAQSQAAGCAFQLGFATVHDLMPAQVGDCVDDEGHNPDNGDGLQHTTKGLMVWRKADNWTAFTNGYWTWINGPDGLAKRLNTQRFSWEANPDGLPVVAADGIVATAPPAANHAMTAPTCCVNSTSVELRPADISANLSYSMVQDGPQGDGKHHRLFRYTGSNSDSRLLTSNLPFTVDSAIHPAPTDADADGDLFNAWVRTRQSPVVAGMLYGGDPGGTYDSYNPSQRIGDRSVITWIASTTPGLQGGVVRVVFRKFNYAMEVRADFQTAGSPVSTDAAVATSVGLATTLESRLETAVTAVQQPAASSTPPSPCCVDASKVLLTLADLPRGWAMTADQFSNGKLFRLFRGPDSPSEEIFLVPVHGTRVRNSGRIRWPCGEEQRG